MAIPNDQIMPTAHIKGNAVLGGIMKDVGDLLAAKLGLRPRYVVVAGDKVGAAMTEGRVDGVCRVLPNWIDGDFHWSPAFLPDGELIAARADAPAVTAIPALRYVPVGTVATFRYPRIAQVLGPQFRRDDAPSLEDILRRVDEGKLQYLLLGQHDFMYHQRQQRPPKLRGDLQFASYKTHCAFARTAPVPPAAIDRAIQAMVADGAIDRILNQYQ